MEITNTRLLIVDDDEDICIQMKWALGPDYEVLTAGDRAGALAAFTACRPTVTLLDLGLPPFPNAPDEGLAALSAVLALDPLAKVIVVSETSARTCRLPQRAQKLASAGFSKPHLAQGIMPPVPDSARRAPSGSLRTPPPWSPRSGGVCPDSP